MPARVYQFPRRGRRRHLPPAPVRYGAIRCRSSFRSGGFTLLWATTLVGEFLYLLGVGGIERHDGLYAALLVAVWGVYFSYERLLKTRLGPLLVQAGRLLLLSGVFGFFGLVYWLILTHP